LARKLMALKFSQKVLIFRKNYTPKFLGCYTSNPRDERRHYPMILHRLKHIGVMETPENVVDEDGGDGAWEHP
jgi:hypothetical protein